MPSPRGALVSAAPSTVPETLRALSHSELTCFMRCPREHHFRYGLRRAARDDAEALRFGRLWSLFLECRYTGQPWLERCTPLAHDAYELAKLTALAMGYEARWEGEPLETVAVELEFQTPIVNPDTGRESRTFLLGGRIDRIARDRATGETILVESKTTSEEIGYGADYWRTITTTDPQVSTYHPGARARGYDVARCVYDVVRKPAQRPLKATPVESRKFTKTGALYANQRETDETPEEYFERIAAAIAEDPNRYYARGDVVRLERDEREHAADVWHQARLIREAELLRRHPRNPQSCRRFGRLCEYFPVCSGQARIEDFPMRTSDRETEAKEV